MFDLPYQNTPCNFPEEERLMKRLYRLMACVQSLAHASRKTRPRFTRDLKGFYWLLGRQVNSIECQLHHPGRLRTWMEEDDQAKGPPPSETLLIRLFSVARQAAADVRTVHNHVAEKEEGREACNCGICSDVGELRWLLGKAKRLLVSEKAVLS